MASNPDPLAAFHEFLRGLSKGKGTTVVEIMEDVRIMAMNKVSTDGLPTNGIECQEWLTRLESQGRAVRDGSFWRWVEGKAVVSPSPAQRELF